MSKTIKMTPPEVSPVNRGIKRKDLYQLRQAFMIISDIDHEHMSYFCEKNVSKIDSEIKRMQHHETSLYPSDKKWQDRGTAYNDEYTRIHKDYAQKDADGNVVMQGNNYVIDQERKEEFNLMIAQMKEEFKDVIDKVEDINKLMEEYLNESPDINWYYAGRPSGQ